MFILYAIPIGLVVGFLLGGRLSGLAEISLRWAPLAIAGLLVQVVLFAEPVSERIGAAGPLVYVLSTAAVFVVVLRNVAIPGMPLVVIGAACNLAAIVANGGYMPASADVAAAVGRAEPSGYSNSAVVEAPLLEPLTDVIALPSWLPFTNIVSVGDLLLAFGIILVIAHAMRSARPARAVSAGNAPI